MQTNAKCQIQGGFSILTLAAASGAMRQMQFTVTSVAQAHSSPGGGRGGFFCGA
jgi:hypothetical protein